MTSLNAASGRWSATDRRAVLRACADTPLDVLVIGGGITGAGILREAALRGARALVVDQGDFASGTSSRSSKLIHGGVRYLAQGQLGLVREVSRERDVLRKLAPHLVRPLPFLVPLYEDVGMRPRTARFGLWLFDRLAGVDRAHRHQVLSVKMTLALVPGLRSDHLTGALRYDEYATNDARLVLETLKAARRHGAQAVNYARVDALTYDHGAVSGARVTDRLTNESYTLHARAVVNAAGPWVDTVRALDTARTVNAQFAEKRLHLTKGIHLVFDRGRFPVPVTVTFAALDGRTIFVIPKGSCTYLGTTDTDYDGDAGNPEATPSDVRYLLDSANRMFPDARLRQSDVMGTWAGVRPLVHEDGKSPSEISRRDEIMVSSTGLISIAGGKLTGFRKMAERAWAVAAKRAGLPAEVAQPSLKSIRDRLGGGEVVDKEEAHRVGARCGVPMNEMDRWIDRYGSNWIALCERCAAGEAERKPLDDTSELVRAEVEYLVECEMAARLEDVLARRTDAYVFTADHGCNIAPQVARAMAPLLGWDDVRIAQEIADYRAIAENSACMPDHFPLQ